MDFDIIIGIDPGKTGGIAIKFNNRYKVYKMPDDLLKIDELLKFYNELGTILIIIEKITLHHTQDIARISRMQKMFAQYEQLKTLFVMNNLQFIEVTPKSWQSYLGLNTKRNRKLKRGQRKKVYRNWAQQWWPEKLIIQVADAVCLLIYGERNLKYNPDFVQLNEKSWKA